MELYHNDMSVCSAKVRLALAEKGLAWTGHHLNLRAGDAQRPEYLKLNPGGVVPTLIDKQRPIIESTVICEYLEDAYPEPPLSPRDPFERARMRLWTKQLDEGIHANTSVISTCIAFRHQHLKKAPQEVERYLASIPSAERRERLRLSIQLGMDSPMFPPAILRFRKMLDDMEHALVDSPWLAGATYSLADIGYAPYIVRLNHLGLDILVNQHRHVCVWFERLSRRPSFEEAVVRWFNKSYLDLFDAQKDAAREKARTFLAA